MPRKKYRRLPDGFGRIIHFGKRNLRNHYTARKRVGSDPEGKPVYKTIGSFPTYAEAFEALVKYHDIEIPPESGISFADLYRRFVAEVLPLPVRGRPLAQSSIAGYDYSFRAVPSLHSRPFVEITAAELQNALYSIFVSGVGILSTSGLKRLLRDSERKFGHIKKRLLLQPLSFSVDSLLTR